LQLKKGRIYLLNQMQKILQCLILILIITFSKRVLSYTEIDFWFTTSDNIQLDCTKCIPDGTPPSGGWPAVILCHGFGLDKYDPLSWAENLADNHVYSLVYSMRGQGQSGGFSNMISTTEMNDLMQMIQYVKTQPNVNPNKIGLGGSSQGGIIPFMAVCNGANVKCIDAELSSPEFASSWINNGGIKMTLLWSASYSSDIVRYNSTTGSFRSWMLSSAKDKWDSLAYYLPLNRDFANKVSSCQVPVLTSNAWQDKFFNSSGDIHAASVLAPSFRMYYGAMDGHGSDTSDAEFAYQIGLVGDWFDYFLLNVQNGVLNPQYKFSYACSSFPIVYESWWTFTRFYSPVWPPSGLNNVQLYFYPNNTLSPQPYSGSQTNIPFLNNVINPNLTMLTAVNYEFTGPQFEAQFGKTEIIFETPQLLQDARLLGIPNVNLFYSSDADICQFNFQIWDVYPDGTKRLVTRANWTDRNYTPNTVKQKSFDGEAYGHIFKASDKIMVILTNLDNTDDDAFLRTNPLELPLLKRANNKVYINSSTRSYIQLPMMNFAIGVKKISSAVPQTFKLEQNYPNPFNPRTIIKYQLPLTNNVKLSVYDILGKEIDALVNERQNPGTYETTWDASKYPSGIYFYRLKTENFIETKKMMVVK
jgi:predicted acyl esterase